MTSLTDEDLALLRGQNFAHVAVVRRTLPHVTVTGSTGPGITSS